MNDDTTFNITFFGDTILDGEDRICHDCGSTEFHRGWEKLIMCNNCYTRWDPVRHLHELFMEISQ